VPAAVGTGYCWSPRSIPAPLASGVLVPVREGSASPSALQPDATLGLLRFLSVMQPMPCDVRSVPRLPAAPGANTLPESILID
jgi:hypothetical protein